MKKKYFLVDVFVKDGKESDIETKLSDKLMTHDKLLKKYMETFVEYMTPEIVAQMSDEELTDEINMWEFNLEEYTSDYMKTVEIYEVNMQTFSISRYEIPTEDMVNYVREWSDNFKN